MAQTKLANLVNPQVMADMISAKLPQQLRFLPLCEVDDTLEGQPGNTITVPKYAYIGDAVDVAEGAEIDTTLLTASTTQVTVKKAGKGVEITDEAALSGYGDPVGEAGKQLLMALASKIDADTVTALGNAVLSYDGVASVISYNGIVDCVDVFGEEDNEVKVIFVHPKQVTSLRKDANFIDKNKYNGEVMFDAEIGQIANCRVITSKRVAENSAKTGYVNFIVKAGALKLYLKRDVLVEPERIASRKCTAIYADEHYTVHLYDDTKVVKATFKK